MGDAEPDILKLGVRLSPAARRHIEQSLAAITGYEPTLGLLYGIDPALEAGRGSWSVAAYAPETVNDLISTYGRFGANVRFELDGIPAVIAQIGQVKQLGAGTLELRHNRLWLMPED
jgi:hypothetical protein